MYLPHSSIKIIKSENENTIYNNVELNSDVHQIIREKVSGCFIFFKNRHLKKTPDLPYTMCKNTTCHDTTTPGIELSAVQN
jgi:hypothetical protein